MWLVSQFLSDVFAQRCGGVLSPFSIWDYTADLVVRILFVIKYFIIIKRKHQKQPSK